MDAHGSTVVAVNAAGDLLGAGDNSYHQYKKAETTPEPSEKAKLDKVSNVTFKTTTGGVSISWDRVTSSDYYEVRLNTSPETVIKAVGNSCNISSDKLTDGTEYLIRITPYTNDDSLAPGEETTVTYQYVANRVKLKTPGDLTLNQEKTELQIHWNSVEHAKEYLVKLGTYEERVRDTSVTLDISALEDGKKYTVSVTAIPDNTRNFADSDPATRDFTYDEPVEAVPLDKPSNINSEQDSVNETILRISWDAVEHATKYTVSVNGKNYDTDQTTLTVDAGAVGLSDGDTYTVKVTASSSDTKHYKNSSAENSFTYRLTPQPTPIPTPEPTVEPTAEPTVEPTPEPTEEPTAEPTEETEEEPHD